MWARAAHVGGGGSIDAFAGRRGRQGQGGRFHGRCRTIEQGNRQGAGLTGDPGRLSVAQGFAGAVEYWQDPAQRQRPPEHCHHGPHAQRSPGVAAAHMGQQ